MKATYLSKLMVASILLLGMFLLPSCGDSENTTEEPGTEINGEENDTIAVNFDHQVTQPSRRRPSGGIPYHISCRSSACKAEQWCYDASFWAWHSSAKHGRSQPAAGT